MYPNWDFWFENKPSGNPAWSSRSFVDSAPWIHFSHPTYIGRFLPTCRPHCYFVSTCSAASASSGKRVHSRVPPPKKKSSLITNLWFAAGHYSVTRWVCERITQNVAQPIFCHNLLSNLYREKKWRKTLRFFSNFQKAVESKQPPNRLKFAQACHPAGQCHENVFHRRPTEAGFLCNEFPNCTSEAIKARLFLFCKTVFLSFKRSCVCSFWWADWKLFT
jgi:hypothetical protein